MAQLCTSHHDEHVAYDAVVLVRHLLLVLWEDVQAVDGEE